MPSDVAVYWKGKRGREGSKWVRHVNKIFKSMETPHNLDLSEVQEWWVLFPDQHGPAKNEKQIQ